MHSLFLKKDLIIVQREMPTHTDPLYAHTCTRPKTFTVTAKKSNPSLRYTAFASFRAVGGVPVSTGNPLLLNRISDDCDGVHGGVAHGWLLGIVPIEP